MKSQTVTRREKDKVPAQVRGIFFTSDQQMIDSEAINVFLAPKVETHILTVDLLTGNYRENSRWLQLRLWCTYFTLSDSRKTEKDVSFE